MLRLTLKNLRANKVRFALTTVGVMLAVSFVVSAFVMGDGLRSTFGGVADETTDGIDLEVRPVADFGDPPPLSADLVDVVADVDGVTDAVPAIEAGWDVVQLLGEDGKPISSDGPPHIAFAWSDNTQLGAFALVDGTAPGLDEFVVDLDSAGKHDLRIGDRYELTTPTGRAHLTLSGTSTFGTDNATVGAVLMQMNADQAGDLFGIDGVNTISIQVDDDADVSVVQAAVQAVGAPGRRRRQRRRRRRRQRRHDRRDRHRRQHPARLRRCRAVRVDLHHLQHLRHRVGPTHSGTGTLADHRRRPRSDPAVRSRRGADHRAVGVGGGIAGGVGVSKGLAALFNATGGSLPDSPTIIATRTIVAALVIGVGVTMLAAIGPARRAGTVPAIAALRGGAEAAVPGSRTRSCPGAGCPRPAWSLVRSG